MEFTSCFGVETCRKGIRRRSQFPQLNQGGTKHMSEQLTVMHRNHIELSLRFPLSFLTRLIIVLTLRNILLLILHRRRIWYGLLTSRDYKGLLLKTIWSHFDNLIVGCLISPTFPSRSGSNIRLSLFFLRETNKRLLSSTRCSSSDALNLTSL